MYNSICFGGIAQLARVLDWQSRGHGFESHYLHQNTAILLDCGVFLFKGNRNYKRLRNKI